VWSVCCGGGPIPCSASDGATSTPDPVVPHSNAPPAGRCDAMYPLITATTDAWTLICLRATHGEDHILIFTQRLLKQKLRR
jgi:hypothetical protein